MTVTLHDVAARAGLSIATVSRVVNGIQVSQDSVDRVNKAVADLGYIPNEAARALRTERVQTIGVIFADLRNTLGIELLDAMSEAVENGGYSLIISTARGDAERYDLLMQKFLEQRIDGLFCIRPPTQSQNLARYLALRIPVITMFERGAAFSKLPLIQPAFDHGAAETARHLKAKGHTRVALVKQHGRSPAMSAIADAVEAEGMLVSVFDHDIGTSMSEVLANLRETNATAMVAPDPQVRGLLAACAESGVRVPGDLGVVSVDEIVSEPYHGRHGISSLTINPQHVGNAAGTLMLDWLAGTQLERDVRVQHATFTARETTALPALRG